MVKLRVVEQPKETPPVRPIGAFQSIATGFDKIAAQPLLLVPLVALDAFLWLGPHLTISSVSHWLVSLFTLPNDIEMLSYDVGTSLLEQVEAFQMMILDLGE